MQRQPHDGEQPRIAGQHQVKCGYVTGHLDIPGDLQGGGSPLLQFFSQQNGCYFAHSVRVSVNSWKIKHNMLIRYEAVPAGASPAGCLTYVIRGYSARRLRPRAPLPHRVRARYFVDERRTWLPME